jgi:hypothetical protein
VRAPVADWLVVALLAATRSAAHCLLVCPAGNPCPASPEELEGSVRQCVVESLPIGQNATTCISSWKVVWGSGSREEQSRERTESKRADPRLREQVAERRRDQGHLVVDVLGVSDAVGIDAEEGVTLGQTGRVVHLALAVRAAVLGEKEPGR